MLGGNHRFSAIRLCRRHTPTAVGILRQLLEAMAHQYRVAFGDDEIACGIPHHSRPKPGIAECFEQGLGFHPIIGCLVKAKRTLQPVDHRAAEAQSLDALCCPVCRHFVAGHTPDLFGIGFEEDREKFVAKLVDCPILETADIFVWKRLRLGIACHAQGRTDDTQVEQCLKRAKRIAVEFAFVVNPAHPGPLYKIVRQNLVPEINHFLRFGKKAVAADIKAVAIDLYGPADAADIAFVLFDYGYAITLLRKQIGGRQASRTRPDNCHIYPVLPLNHKQFPLAICFPEICERNALMDG